MPADPTAPQQIAALREAADKLGASWKAEQASHAAELARADDARTAVERKLADAEAHAVVLAERVRVLEQQGGPAKSTDPFSVGVNLEPNRYYASDAAFANLFHRFSGGGDPNGIGWGLAGTAGKASEPWKPAPGLKLSPAGYPLSDAAAHSNLYGYAGGDYQFTKAGSGTVTFGGKLSPAADRPGVVRLNAAHEGQAVVAVRGIDPADPPRDFRLVPAGAPAGVAANPAFRERVRPFSTLRFMDWCSANNTLVEKWADRVKPGDWLQASERGVAYEHMAAVARECEKDLWVCVPVAADDDYLASMAQVVKDGTRLGQRVYAAYGNELFNVRTKAAAWFWRQSAASPHAEGDANERAWRFLAFNVRRVASIWRQVWGAGGRGNDLRVVYETQGADIRWAETGLKWYDSHYGDPAADIYALAVTGYYNVWEGDAANPGGDEAKITALAKEGKADEALAFLFDRLNAAIDVPRKKLPAHAALANRYRLPGGVLSYEGGTHLVDKGASDGPVKAAAWSDPRMRDVCRKIIDAWRRDGGGHLFEWFNFASRGGRFGRWGLLESLLQADTPRMLGVLDALEAAKAAAAPA